MMSYTLVCLAMVAVQLVVAMLVVVFQIRSILQIADLYRSAL